jgi:ATP-dependent Clp protease ATP-binding subunit ClpC
MFERFTDGSRRVVVLAQDEARMLYHGYVGTEHILLGLIHEGGGAARTLASLGISLDAVRQQVEEIIGRGQQAPSGHIPFTPRAKKVLELSLRESLQLGQGYIGPEHILLGLLREGDGVAAQVLVRLGADLNRVREQVIQLLHEYPGQEAASAGSQPGEGARAGLPDDALARFDALDRRLTALERWVSMQPDLEGLDQQIAQVRRDLETAAARQDSQAATALRDKEKELLAARADREKEWAGSAAGRRTVARELDRLNTELERLRATLREHGIEPGDPA